MRREAQVQDLLSDSWGYDSPKPKKLVANHICSQCKKYCTVTYVEDESLSGLLHRVSVCCGVKNPKVKRYVYEKSKKG